MLEKFFNDPNIQMNVFETMKDALMLIDSESKIVYVNKAAEDITGYTKEEIIGEDCTMLDSDTCMILTDSGKKKNCSLFTDGSISNKRCRIKAKDGGSHYLMKNAVLLKDSDGEIIGAVETMTDITSLYMKQLELEELKKELRQEYWFMGLLGRSRSMQALYEQIRNAASSEAPVLIYGESGTGKNLVANAIHRMSRRKEGPFIKMNCAALNEFLLESELFGHKKGSFTGAISDRQGRFEAAQGGSILLDEIGDMPHVMQAKLLRVLEEKVLERVGDNTPIPVDIRLISATNRDVNDLVDQRRFREDLLYRVNSIVIRTPSLKERVDDIPLLAAHYLKKISVVNSKNIQRMSSSAMDLLTNYTWPGNVRQLISSLEHCAVTCKGDTIEVSDLPDYVFSNGNSSGGKYCECAPIVVGSGAPRSYQETRGGRKHIDQSELRMVLSRYDGNRTLTAKHFGVSRVTLWKRIKEFGL